LSRGSIGSRAEVRPRSSGVSALRPHGHLRAPAEPGLPIPALSQVFARRAIGGVGRTTGSVWTSRQVRADQRRSESILNKTSFRKTAVKRRALVPAHYEWQKTEDRKKIPNYLYSEKDDVLAFAGLYGFWPDLALPGPVIVIRPARGRPTTARTGRMNQTSAAPPIKKSSGVGLKASVLEAVSADTVTAAGDSVVLGVTVALGSHWGQRGRFAISATHDGLSRACFLSVESRRRAARMITRSSGLIPLSESSSRTDSFSARRPIVLLSRSGLFQASAMIRVSSLPERLLALRSSNAARPTSCLAGLSVRLASNAHRALGHQSDWLAAIVSASKTTASATVGRRSANQPIPAMRSTTSGPRAATICHHSASPVWTMTSMVLREGAWFTGPAQAPAQTLSGNGVREGCWSPAALLRSDSLVTPDAERFDAQRRFTWPNEHRVAFAGVLLIEHVDTRYAPVRV